MNTDRKSYRDQLRATDIFTLRMLERALDSDARRTQSNLALLRRELKRRSKNNGTAEQARP